MLSLFSGIGGIDLAAQWAGIETVAFCEIDPFCQKILRKHWPHVPIYSDIRQLRGDMVGTVDIVAAGYPCQPYSQAGGRKGENDDRALWPYLFERIHETRPRWFVGENVAGHISLGLDDVLSDMESISYTTQSFVIPAAGVGSFHQRARVFVVAHAGGFGQHSLSDVSEIARQNLLEKKGYQGFRECGFERGVGGRIWPMPDAIVFRMANGFSSGMDAHRIKALGNAVMPQQIYPIFRVITEINNILKCG